MSFWHGILTSLEKGHVAYATRNPGGWLAGRRYQPTVFLRQSLDSYNIVRFISSRVSYFIGALVAGTHSKGFAYSRFCLTPHVRQLKLNFLHQGWWNMPGKQNRRRCMQMCLKSHGSGSPPTQNSQKVFDGLTGSRKLREHSIITSLKKAR